MNGFIQIKKNTELWDFQKQGNYDQWKWFIETTPCILTFFKRKESGESTIILFNANKVHFEADNTIVVDKIISLSPTLFNQNGNFFALEAGTCFLPETGLFYFDFTTNNNNTYQTGLICITDLAGIPIPDNALFDVDADEYVLTELGEYILIPD